MCCQNQRCILASVYVRSYPSPLLYSIFLPSFLLSFFLPDTDDTVVSASSSQDGRDTAGSLSELCCVRAVCESSLTHSL